MPSVESVLLLTDIVDSTKITEVLGDERAAEAWLAHDAAARRLMPATAREIDRTDGAGASYRALHRLIPSGSTRWSIGSRPAG